MPKVTQVVVSAGRTFNHPHESYSNLRPSVSVTAEILPGEDATEVITILQAKVESLVENHKENMLQSIRDSRLKTSLREGAARLQTTIEQAQREVDEARNKLACARITVLGMDDGATDNDEDDDEDAEDHIF